MQRVGWEVSKPWENFVALAEELGTSAGTLSKLKLGWWQGSCVCFRVSRKNSQVEKFRNHHSNAPPMSFTGHSCHCSTMSVVSAIGKSLQQTTMFECCGHWAKSATGSHSRTGAGSTVVRFPCHSAWSTVMDDVRIIHSLHHQPIFSQGRIQHTQQAHAITGLTTPCTLQVRIWFAFVWTCKAQVGHCSPSPPHSADLSHYWCSMSPIQVIEWRLASHHTPVQHLFALSHHKPFIFIFLSLIHDEVNVMH